MKPPHNWHSRFTQQARWTHDLRKYLFEQVDILHTDRILEVGCGTGAILSELPGFSNAQTHGLDISHSRLLEARINASLSGYAQGDALFLPYPAITFDVTFCHFLLLWVKDPLQVLIEMHRVTCPGGFVLLMAEPDYTKRIDLPHELELLGFLQTQSLQDQGADPSIGSKLSILMKQAGFNLIETGLLKQDQPGLWDPHSLDLEWAVLESDLQGLLSSEKMAYLKDIDLVARMAGERILYVPTHFAWGRV